MYALNLICIAVCAVVASLFPAVGIYTVRIRPYLYIAYQDNNVDATTSVASLWKLQ